MTTPDSHSPSTTPIERPRRLRRALVIGVVAIVAALTGAFASNAFSQGFGPPWHARSFFGQAFDPAAIEDRADRMVRHLSIEVDATARAAGAAARHRPLRRSRPGAAARKGDELAPARHGTC